MRVASCQLEPSQLSDDCGALYTPAEGTRQDRGCTHTENVLWHYDHDCTRLFGFSAAVLPNQCQGAEGEPLAFAVTFGTHCLHTVHHRNGSDDMIVYCALYV